jgi:hypothetical protein
MLSSDLDGSLAPICHALPQMLQDRVDDAEWQQVLATLAQVGQDGRDCPNR